MEPRRAFFVCVSLIVLFSYVFFFLSRSNIISDVYFRGRKHALRKTAYLSNQASDSSAVYLRRKPTFTAIVLVPLKNQFNDFFNPKHAPETNATNNTPPT